MVYAGLEHVLTLSCVRLAYWIAALERHVGCAVFFCGSTWRGDLTQAAVTKQWSGARSSQLGGDEMVGDCGL